MNVPAAPVATDAASDLSLPAPPIYALTIQRTERQCRYLALIPSCPFFTVGHRLAVEVHIYRIVTD